MAAPYPVALCGTVAAFRGHKRRGEPVDEACREAKRIWWNEYRARKAGREPYARAESNAIPHGTPQGYRRCAAKARVTHGKTCEPCRAAWRKHFAMIRGVEYVERTAPFYFEPEPVPAGQPACTAGNVDPEWFFTYLTEEHPDLSKRQLLSRNASATRKAKQVCEGCTIREQCLRDNLDQPFGIFGGLSRVDRLRLQNSGYSQREPASFFDQHVGLVAANGEGVNHVS